jgi:hypothetical protein
VYKKPFGIFFKKIFLFFFGIIYRIWQQDENQELLLYKHFLI